MRTISYLVISVLLMPSMLLAQTFYPANSSFNADLDVYITSITGIEDVSVYITSISSLADVVFFPAICIDNNSYIRINFNSIMGLSDIDVYIASISGISDVDIYFTSIQSNADYIICFPHQVSEEEIHKMGAAAAAYLHENGFLN